VKRDDLEKSGDLTKMLNYGKSDLVKVSPTFGGETFELDARLSFRKGENGSISLVPHFIRKEQKLDEYKGHKFSDEDRKNLREEFNELKRGLIKYRNHIFNVLENQAIPSDNNASERGIQKLKMKQKISGCFRSDTGTEVLHAIHSITDTAWKNNKSPLDAILVLV